MLVGLGRWIGADGLGLWRIPIFVWFFRSDSKSSGLGLVFAAGFFPINMGAASKE